MKHLKTFAKKSQKRYDARVCGEKNTLVWLCLFIDALHVWRLKFMIYLYIHHSCVAFEYFYNTRKLQGSFNVHHALND